MADSYGLADRRVGGSTAGTRHVAERDQIAARINDRATELDVYTVSAEAHAATSAF
jgi:hypothetical protein